MANTTFSKPTPADMEVTPERAMAIKLALIKQYEDQFGVEVLGWEETTNGVTTKVDLKKLRNKQAPA